MHIDEIFDRLWFQYSTENPSVKKIHDLFESEGESIVNDHVAFRTFNDPRVGVDVLSKPFTARGYKEAGSYRFPEKKLFARHYEKDGYPRVFISELLLEEFSGKLQAKITDLIDSCSAESPDPDRLIMAGNVFGDLSHHVYELLREESEYAAWVYAYGYRANHFTVSINHLNKYDTIEKVNRFLKDNGFKLNTSGGEIKGTPQQLLEQSSTLADRVKVTFSEGEAEIPSCYYEFARRYRDADGKLFSGFIAGSADKIFESTDYRK
jgi:hypothetical protein